MDNYLYRFNRKVDVMIHNKIVKFIKRYRIAFIFIVIFLGVFIQPKHIYAAESTIVRVGYPEVTGFTEIKEGVYSGYAYEYLMEIAKYTGWEYEFIEVNVKDMLEMLRDGEIDIAGGMLQNDYTTELYDFPEENAGFTYKTVSVLKDNDSISSSNYNTLNGIKIGYYGTSSTNLDSFLKFCENNGIKDIKLIPYTDDGSNPMLDALKRKEIDAILGGNLLIQGEQKIVATFGATPYYFATTKGNKDILTGLNYALSKIKQNNASFERELYNRYFLNYIDPVVHLTPEEQDYINNMTSLKAVYVDNFAPLQDYNQKTMKAEGTYIDVMELIAEKTGLKYNLVKVSTYKQALEMIKNKEADIIIGIPDSYSKAIEYEYALTQGYTTISMVRVYNMNGKSKEGEQILALPVGYIYDELDGEYEIRYYETVEDCLIAVNEGKADLTYGNSNTISNYITTGYYTNLSFVFDDSSLHICIGLSKPINVILLNILNKSLSSISDSEMSNIVYTNLLSGEKAYTLKQFFVNNTMFCIAIILLILLLIYINVRNGYKRLAEDKLVLLEKTKIDALTRVYNRVTGEELVTASLQKNKDSEYSALAIIDIDYFKQINDLLGHQRGDELLIEFSQVAKQVFSPTDIIFRLGGDEFVVFMTKLETKNLEIVDKKLQEICNIMNKELNYMGISQKISLSIGAVITNQICDFDHLYQEADKMLYEVKRNGRNGYRIKKLD